MWDSQMLFLAQHGFRVVAHDRRGHGRSSQAWSGNDMDGYADDLAAVIGALDVTDITMVGHSTGGGEVARYIGRYGTKRVAKAVLIAARAAAHVENCGQSGRAAHRRSRDQHSTNCICSSINTIPSRMSSSTRSPSVFKCWACERRDAIGRGRNDTDLCVS
jgi:pimeloyl-ACP methyl ester carboxylesterase